MRQDLRKLLCLTKKKKKIVVFNWARNMLFLWSLSKRGGFQFTKQQPALHVLTGCHTEKQRLEHLTGKVSLRSPTDCFFDSGHCISPRPCSDFSKRRSWTLSMRSLWIKDDTASSCNRSRHSHNGYTITHTFFRQRPHFMSCFVLFPWLGHWRYT